MRHGDDGKAAFGRNVDHAPCSANLARAIRREARQPFGMHHGDGQHHDRQQPVRQRQMQRRLMQQRDDTERRLQRHRASARNQAPVRRRCAARHRHAISARGENSITHHAVIELHRQSVLEQIAPRGLHEPQPRRIRHESAVDQGARCYRPVRHRGPPPARRDRSAGSTSSASANAVTRNRAGASTGVIARKPSRFRLCAVHSTAGVDRASQRQMKRRAGIATR